MSTEMQILQNGMKKLEIELNSSLNHLITQQLEDKNKIVKFEITYSNIHTLLRQDILKIEEEKNEFEAEI